MRPRLKAQIALEFLLLAAFFLLVLTVAVGYFASLQQTEMRNREYLLGREVASRIADEVHTSLLSGAGYSKTITLPQTIAGARYNLLITNEENYGTAFVELSWKRGSETLEYSEPLAYRGLLTFYEAHPSIAGSGNIGPGNPHHLSYESEPTVPPIIMTFTDTDGDGFGDKLDFSQTYVS